MRLPIAGLPPQKEPPPPPAVPKGWKINAILPLHSPAVSGGGVSENLKDLLPPGMAGLAGEAAESSGGEGKKGKNKKKGKA
jgi:signal recognition particle subunit SRP19